MLAKQKRHALFDPDDGQEKQAQVVIDAGIVGLCQSADGAASGGSVDTSGFRLYPGDQKHGVLPVGLRPFVVR